MSYLNKIMFPVFLLAFVFSASAVTLFEIKDEVGSPVLVVSSDGLRILNGADTLMVISSTGIKAFIDDSKALSRTFSVSTSASKGSASSVLDVTTSGLNIFDQTPASKALGDTLMTISSRSIKAHIASGSKGLSRSFSVSTSASKGDGNMLNIGTDSTKIGTGTTTMGQYGSRYTNFSPENIFLGLNAGAATTSGTSNTYMGNNAGKSATLGTQNVMIGESAGELLNGSNYGNIFIGKDAAKNLTDGSRNVMIGYCAGSSPISTFTSLGNVFLGAVAGYKVSGNYNVMIGEAAGENYNLGSTGYENIFLGKDAGRFATGHNNVYIGCGSGEGLYDDVNPGSNNIFIGTDEAWTNKDSDRLSIGGLLYGNTSTNKLVVAGSLADNTMNRTFFANGSAGGTTVWNNDSDERLKKNIFTIEKALDKVTKLRGVTYEWKDVEKYEKGRRMGFIAQEAKDLVPEAVDYDAANDKYTMQYSTLTAILVEAVKELKQEISSGSVAQDEKINTLIKENKELKSKVQELESLRAEIESIRKQMSGYTSR